MKFYKTKERKRRSKLEMNKTFFLDLLSKPNATNDVCSMFVAWVTYEQIASIVE